MLTLILKVCLKTDVMLMLRLPSTSKDGFHADEGEGEHTPECYYPSNAQQCKICFAVKIAQILKLLEN